MVDSACDGHIGGRGHDVLVEGSLIVDVVDYVLDGVVNVTLDDFGVDSDVMVDSAIDGDVGGGAMMVFSMTI